MLSLQLIALWIPALFTMIAYWMNDTCLNALPKHAFAESRRHVRWGLIYLLAILIQLGMASYMSINLVEKQHQQSIAYGK